MSAGSSSSLVFPEELLCDEQVFDVACHPTADYVAVGMIDGAVALYDYVAIADKVATYIFFLCTASGCCIIISLLID